MLRCWWFVFVFCLEGGQLYVVRLNVVFVLVWVVCWLCVRIVCVFALSMLLCVCVVGVVFGVALLFVVRLVCVRCWFALSMFLFVCCVFVCGLCVLCLVWRCGVCVAGFGCVVLWCVV